MSDLTQKKCQACRPGTPPLSPAEIETLLPQVPGWELRDAVLTRDVTVKNFAAALSLVNRIGGLAEEENHHPDICIHGWNHVRVDLSTHSIGGLSDNDFILAAKINQLEGF